MNTSTNIPANPLNNASLALARKDVSTPRYDRKQLVAGIAHIGVGNFHRTHQALYVDRYLHMPGQENWALCGIGLNDGAAARQKSELFEKQDCLYTLTEFAPKGGSTQRVIGSIIEYLHAPSDPEAVTRKLADAAIRIVSLTITEGGYNIDEGTGNFIHDAPDVVAELADGVPRTAFGFIVEALARRKAAAITPFTVVSCDNLRHNGDTARRSIVSFARLKDPVLADWIDQNVCFPNSMVDRAAPQVSAKDRETLSTQSGFHDELAVTGEEFTQWVIEDRFCAGRPPFEDVGVEFRSDVAAFEGIKGRMLNASHMLLAYPALLTGQRLVAMAMTDARLKKLLATFMTQDVMPLLVAPQGVSLEAYRDGILERFANVALADQVLRVAHDGASKIPVFYSNTLPALLQAGVDLRRVAFLLATFRRYMKGIDDNGLGYDVIEPHLNAIDRALLADEDPIAMLHSSPFQSMHLYNSAAFQQALISVSSAIETRGVSKVLEELISD